MKTQRQLLSAGLVWLAFLTFNLQFSVAPAQTTAFTYQGRLGSGGNPANGVYDLKFSLFNTNADGIALTPPVTNNAVTVSNGLFTTLVDFGSGAFAGGSNWLEIAVSTNGASDFATLTPRQQVTPTPYAVMTEGVIPGGVTAGMIADGAVTGSKIDDGGSAAYTAFQQVLAAGDGDSPVAFTDVSPFSGAAKASFTLTVKGASLGTVLGFSGDEEISRPYSYLVEVQSAGLPVNPDSQIGLPAHLTFSRNGRSTSFNGIVTFCALSGASGADSVYLVRIEPPLAYLKLTADYRMVQNTTAPASSSSLYQEATGNAAAQNLTSTYSTHDTLVQYAETDLNFFNRLLEKEGVFYLFNQSQTTPNPILADNVSAYLSAPNSPFTYYGNGNTNVPPNGEYIRTFQKAVRQSTLQSVVNSYNFTTPAAALAATNTAAAGLGTNYEFGPSSVQTLAYDQQLAAARQKRQAVERALIDGSSTAPDLRAGYTFALTDNSGAGLGGNYLVTSVHHAAFTRVTNGVSVIFYGNRFEAVPAALNFCPAVTTPKPQAQPCIATVTGPSGETTYVDQYGRVKLQFKWDRRGNADQSSSGWVRVTSPMAGANHGMIFLPQVGDEVLVSFIQGDPDQPVVTGSLYNANAAPPYPLPGNNTVSTIQSVAKDGQVNEIKFDDKTGNQTLNIHAAKDLNFSAVNKITFSSGAQTAFTGPVSVGSLTVNGSTTFGNLQAGQVILPSGASASYTNVTITFPKAFITTPKVIATVNADPAWDVPDTFAASVRKVSTTGVVVNILRVDAATGWSQVLRVNWIAWE